jgi:hypothetical protein
MGLTCGTNHQLAPRDLFSHIHYARPPKIHLINKLLKLIFDALLKTLGFKRVSEFVVGSEQNRSPV